MLKPIISRSATCLCLLISMLICGNPAVAQSIPIWPALAPGETTKDTGTTLPGKDDKITRVENVSAPTLNIYLAEKPNGAGLLVLPGGGFRYVVPDLEGSELAPALNAVGVNVFVLRYRVSGDTTPTAWKKPVQDSQRAMRYLRAHADQYQLLPKRLGLLGFSAGGQVAAWHATQSGAAYAAIDQVDEEDAAPNFLALVYPWQLCPKADAVPVSNPILQMQFTETTPRTFIVGTSDDTAADPRGAAQAYLDLRRLKVDTELHLFRTGGHGYGVREKPNSSIHKWQTAFIDWLRTTGVL